MTRREPVLAQNGLVATAHPLATLAGINVLQKGGNAFDAALAAAFVTNVVLPNMCGPGGDAFIIAHQAQTGTTVAINGSGKSPLGATPEYYRGLGYQMMPLDGLLSVAVPGAVDAYFQLHRLFGSWPVPELVRPAVDYARFGFPVAPKLSREIAEARGKLSASPAAARTFLHRGEPLPPGAILRQEDLAATLEAIAQGGPDVFYRGEIGRQVAEFSRRHGGLLSEEDLAQHKSEIYEPLRTVYRGWEILQTAPPSQGFMVLEALNILEGYDLATLGPGSPEAIHLLVETKKLVYADRLRYAGDPEFVKFPLRGLLSKEYAARQRVKIRPEHVFQGELFGDPWPFEGDTTYLAVVDRAGNAVSFIHSLSHSFGSGVMVEGTGILLNNRAGRGFTLSEGHPNQLAPGKRTMHTLNCWMIMKDGRPVFVGGTPGGDGQPQWNVQLITHLLDFGMSPQEAVEFPRWTSFPGTDPALLSSPPELRMEDRFSSEVAKALAEKGHPVKILGSWAAGGGAQIIKIDRERGLLEGGSDPRVEGLALGF